MPSPAHYATFDEDEPRRGATDSLASAERGSQSKANVQDGSLQLYGTLPSSVVNNFPVKGQRQECDTEELLTVCENCDGAGEFVSQYITGYDPRDGSPLGWEDQYPCPECGGTGRVLTEVEPIDISDLDAIHRGHSIEDYAREWLERME